MRSGYNPTRRNRNIGTAKQGHGQNNRLRIAEPWSFSGIYWSRLGRYKVVHRSCGGRDLPFFVEETRADCVHACTVDDIATVFRLIPDEHYSTLAAVVLRQPKRKEQILASVWGRLVYRTDVGRPQDGHASGPTIVLEAQAPARPIWCSKSADPARATELDRLVEDGHTITQVGSRLRIDPTPAAIRATQLYRTVPHEIGHLVDYKQSVPDEDEARGISWDRHFQLFDRYLQRPPQEKESFAHRYADAFRAQCQASGALPFPRIESWDDDGLRSSDFAIDP